MADEDEWSYDVGEFDDEEEPHHEADDATQQASTGDDEDDGGWRFSLSDLEEDDEEEEDEEGWPDLSAEVEAGSPELENVVFVLLGVALGVVVAVQLFL